jgi:acid phosphatase (class A)
MKLFFVLLFLAGHSIAGDLVYLKSDSIDVSGFIPVSDDQLKDVLNFQKSRTKEDCERASFEAKGFADSFFGPPYGPLSHAEAKRLVDFQETLFQEVKYFAKILKTQYQVKRPYVASSKVTPCVPPENSFSYPSGHAAISIVAAKTFALLHPEFQDALLLRAKTIAFDRVLGGVHFPDDVETGRKLGELIFQALKSEPAFIEDVRKLKQ